MAHCNLPFVSKLSSILLRNQFLKADIVLGYASSMQRKLLTFFLFKSATISISCIVFIYDCATIQW